MKTTNNQAELIKSLFRFVPYSAGLLYVLGVLVQNVYLNKYGITDVSLFRIQYIVIGAEFAIYLSFPFISIILPFHIIFLEYRHLFGPNSLKTILFKISFFLGISLFLIASYLSLFRFLITERAGYSLKSYNLPPFSLLGEIVLSMISIAAVIYFLFFLIHLILPRTFLSNFIKTLFRTISGLFIVLYFVSGLSFYPGVIHRFIARSFSGGQPILADIRVSEEFIKLNLKLGKHLVVDSLMRRQAVIYADSNYVYLLRHYDESLKTIVIPKKYVEYMIIHRPEKESSSENTTDTQTPTTKEKSLLK